MIGPRAIVLGLAVAIGACDRAPVAHDGGRAVDARAPQCHVDADCTALGLVCDVATSSCVDCRDSLDCVETGFCNAAHACVPDACSPGASSCIGDQIATCRSDGSGMSAPRACPGGRCVGDVCVVTDAGP